MTFEFTPRKPLTTRHFEKLRDMGYPAGCFEWGPLEIDVRYSEWCQRRNRNALLIVAFCAALGGLSVWFSLGGL